jgi:glutaredoxin 3
MEYSVDDPTVMAVFIETHQGVRQMPQIFIEGQRVGGLAGLQQALKELGL